MKFSIPQRLCTLALTCLIAIGTFSAAILPPRSAHAHDTFPSGSERIKSTNNDDDWCVWTESNTCNYQPEDDEASASDSLATVTHRSSHHSHRRISRTASNFEQSMAAVAIAACSNVGVSFQHVSELFALMDLPIQSHKPQATAADTVAIDEIDDDVDAMNLVSLVPLVDFRNELPLIRNWSPLLASADIADKGNLINDTKPSDGSTGVRRDDEPTAELATDRESQEQLDALAMEDSIDADADSFTATGQGDLITQSNQPAAASDATPQSPLVGTSAMILTIEEVCLPSDLAARDVPWSPSVMMFCIRKLDEPQDLPVESPTPTDEDMKQIEEFLSLVRQQSQALAESLRPINLGQRIAHMVAARGSWTSQIANRMVIVWPPIAKPAPVQAAPRPMTAGDQLLVRAGVVPVPADRSETAADAIIARGAIESNRH